MARERDYLSNAEYDEAVRRFYNGLNYTEHIVYKENIIDQLKINPRVVEEYLIEGERYTLLDRGYCITSYGRVFNLRFRRFLTPKFYNSDIYIYCGQDSYKLQPIFNEMGWKIVIGFDHAVSMFTLQINGMTFMSLPYRASVVKRGP